MLVHPSSAVPGFSRDFAQGLRPRPCVAQPLQMKPAKSLALRGMDLAELLDMSRSGRILVVDDEVNARTALAELLRDEGFEVETAADAFKALGKYEAFAPHIVVTDLKMPGMDGIELVHKLRAQEDPPAVIVMTAFGAVSSAVDSMRAGAAEYLTKPINFD